MKYTLLDIVNSSLTSMDSFQVSDIDDVLESQQVADIAEDVFHEVINDIFSDTLTRSIIELDALADTTKPNYLKIPDNVTNIHESTIRYNVTDGVAGNSTINWKVIDYLHPQDFLDRIGGRSTNQTNTQIVGDFSGVDFVIKNKTAPTYCTSFDDTYLVFDAFDSDVDSTLQSSKSQALVSKQGTWTPSSTYVIDLPEWFHPTYLNLVKARASEELRDEPNATAVRKGEVGLIKARIKMRVGNTKFQRKKYGR